ncbi:MAG: hypothetical protein JNK82_35330 [Myxococcaceae bacterium]|nr:hypothetical protein [Myxococcaceae bacterium]
MRFTRESLWDAPFPSDDLKGEDRIDLGKFPTRNIALVAQVRSVAARAGGFSTSAGIFFTLTGAPGPLPALADTVKPASPVFLVELHTGLRYPIEVGYSAEGSRYGAPKQLALLPLQGVPLEPARRYAAVVLRALNDEAGAPLGVSLSMAQLLAGRTPEGMGDATAAEYHEALRGLGVPAADVAGLAVFTTGQPTVELQAFYDAASARPPPALTAPLVQKEVFDEYCVFESKVPMPVYQSGTPPYATTGGTWGDPADGPVRTEDARLFITVPRRAMPDAGWGLVDFIPAGGGADRTLIERVVRGADGGDASDAGTGPALHLARAGFVGLTVDGPLVGSRNPTGGDEQFLLFNLTNLPALRDNLRQSALEVALHTRLVDTGALNVDVSSCPGATSPLHIDPAHLALMGHSMGATILPLAAAVQPRVGALVLSGAGGSWVHNLIYKAKPIEVRPFAELLVDVPAGSLTAFDPLVSLVQWAAEGADPPLYGPSLRGRVHVLMEQGIVDHYILPRIANATSLSLALDLAGPALDDAAELVDQQRALDVLPLVGRGAVSLPATANRDGKTAVVVQHLSDGVQDGHEVLYQLDAPKHQVRCFLQTWLRGAPVVPPGGPADAACE